MKTDLTWRHQNAKKAGERYMPYVGPTELGKVEKKRQDMD